MSEPARGSRAHAGTASLKPELVHVTTIPLTVSLFLKGQIPFMEERGFRVSVATSPGPELEEIAETQGVTVYPVRMVRGISPIADLITLFRLWLLFVRTKPAIVHSSTPKGGPLAMLASYLAGVPVRIYTLRGVMMDRRTGLARRFIQIMEWIGCHCADEVLAVSPSVAEVIVGAHLCPASKIRVLGKGSSNGVDAKSLFNPTGIDKDSHSRLRTRHGIPEESAVIGCVGRIVRGKGIIDLTEAWRVIRHDHETAYLLMIGPPESQDPVPDAILAELRADPRVVMVNFVPKEEMPLYYNTMDVVAFPTYSEGFPNVPLEAAAMEVPVVATRVTGCVDAVKDGVTGVFVPPGDPPALAKAIKRYIDSPELRLNHGRAAREIVLRDFRPEQIWEALYQEYVLHLENKGKAVPVPVSSTREPDKISIP